MSISKLGVALTGPPKSPAQLEVIKASQWTRGGEGLLGKL